jgi:predicted small secreted protein
VRRVSILLIALLPLAVAITAAGCGGGSDNNNGGGTLSTTDELKVAQYRADVDEFCALAQGSHTGDLYDRAFFTVVNAADNLVLIYKKDPKGVYHDELKKTDIKMSQVLSDASKKLKGCGKDGKVQAQKLTNAIQS